jgi:hypothetical protein
MPEISVEALIVCIQAVAAEIHTLSEAAQSGELQAEEYERLEKRERVAENLEAAYDKVAERVLNLPPYDELVR